MSRSRSPSAAPSARITVPAGWQRPLQPHPHRHPRTRGGRPRRRRADPITLNADVPVDVPFVADFGDLTLQGFTIPGFNVTTTNWTTLRNQATSAPLGNVYLDFNVPGTVLPVGDITLDPITVGLPTLSGTIGGPGFGFGLNLDGGFGPFTIDVPIGVSTDPLGINVDQVLVSQIPIFANVAVPVDVPVSLSATPITISPITVPQITIGTARWVTPCRAWCSRERSRATRRRRKPAS